MRRHLLRERRQQGHDDRERRDEGAPVNSHSSAPKPAAIAVYPARVIQRRHVVPPALDDPVVAHEDPGDGRHEDRVRAHEGQEARRGRHDDPRTQGPAAEQGDQHDAPPDAEPLRRERRRVVGERDRVRADVDGDLREEPQARGEEGCRATAGGGRGLPRCDDLEGRPVGGAVDLCRGARGDDAADADEGLEQGDEGQLPELGAAGAGEAGEVGDVDGEGGVAACYACLLGVCLATMGEKQEDRRKKKKKKRKRGLGFLTRLDNQSHALADPDTVAGA